MKAYFERKAIDLLFTGKSGYTQMIITKPKLFLTSRKSIQSISNLIFLFQRTLENLSFPYRDVGGVDITSAVFEDVCRQTSKEWVFKNCCLDRYKNKREVKY